MSDAPIAASHACSRASAAGSRTAAMSAPAAPPANTNPAHGNAVNIVMSPVGRTYNCSQIGRRSTSTLARMMGVSIANAVAIAAYPRTTASVRRRLAQAATPQTTPDATMAGPMMFRMSTRKSSTTSPPGVTTSA